MKYNPKTFDIKIGSALNSLNKLIINLAVKFYNLYNIYDMYFIETYILYMCIFRNTQTLKLVR